MAKAHVTLPSGTKVTIEGTEEEVAKLVPRLEGTSNSRGNINTKARPLSNSSPTVTDLINRLIEEGLLKKPTDLATIKGALEQQGHYYGNPTVATALLRLVKRRQLRRVKQDGQWRYVR